MQNGGRRAQKPARNGGGKSANPRREFERYVSLARAAETSGDHVARESYYQHAEHYYRLMNGDGQVSAA
jgi:hypothetical protein